MSQKLTTRIIDDLERLRLAPFKVTVPNQTLEPIAAKLRQAGFRPTRLGPRLTSFSPVARPSNIVITTDPANPKGITHE